MNLKDAFRYQNKMDAFIESAQTVLRSPGNITTTTDLYLRKKVVPAAENEEIVAEPSFEYADKITELVEFTAKLIDEKAKLYAAISEAKRTADIDIDSETALNKQRQAMARTLQRMLTSKSKETILQNQGTGYTMNNDGNQVQYRCDVKRVVTINFDRNVVQAKLKALNAKADEVSEAIDKAVINTQVDFTTDLFDVNDTFEDAFGRYVS